MENPIPLLRNAWANGNISDNDQWFKFTANSSTQYIHVIFGTLNNLNVQLYDNSMNLVGIQSNLQSTTTRISRSLTNGNDYYIRIWPFNSSNKGTFRITFNTSTTAPSQ